MKQSRNRALGHLMLAVLCGLLAPVAGADDSGRRYDSGNRFQGTYRVTESGTIRLYDAKGNYEGKVVPTRDGDRLDRYDALGNYAGSIEEGESEE